ncbi:MAG: serine/threonine-protein kinase [Candidatus Obscuribacterales bacterium]|nr:serine/threonine-protein kinase [Candidatus Obscuribacterales bacterium]
MTDSDNTLKQHYDADSLIGQTIAQRYEILSLISKGGVGIVYKARHIFLDRLVALKLLRKDVVHDPRTHQRFQQEAKAVGVLNHPNIVPVFDFGFTEAEEAFIVMDFVKGIDLDIYVQESGPGNQKTMIPLFIQIADALSHAHKHGIIHRDLKPGNVIIVKLADGSIEPHLVDFGMAKLHQEGKADLSLTKPGEIFGSPYYMSPEQCLGKKLDKRSDIYSMGCLMHEVLSGQPPFIGKNMVEMAKLHLNGKAKPISSITPAMQGIIDKALNKLPEERQQTMDELLNELRALPEGSRIKMPPKEQTHKQKRILVYIAITALLIIGSMTFYSQKQIKNNNETPEQTDSWAALNEKATDLARNNRLPEAETAYLDAVKLAESGGPDQTIYLARSLSDLGEIYYKERKYDLCEIVLERAIECTKTVKGTQSAELAPVLLRLGKLYIEMGRLTEAESVHKEALEIVENTFGNEHPQMSPVLRQYAKLKVKQGKVDAASHLVKHARRIESKLRKEHD